MNEKITATITTEKATVNAFNPENDEMTNIECFVRKSTAEKDAIAFCEAKNLIFCEIMNITKGKEVKYELDSSLFMLHALKVEKRPNGNYISRSLNLTSVQTMVYNTITHKAEVKTIVIDTKNPEKFEAEIKRALKKDENPKRFLKIMSTNTTTVLYVMSTEKFIELATIAE